MASRSRRSVILAAALSLMVGACFGDPPPAAEDLPLEIVVHPDECLINYPRVGPGVHQVTVIFEGADGSVRIVGAGDVVLWSDEGIDGDVDLVVGDYRVECETEAVTRVVALEVREGLPPGGN